MTPCTSTFSPAFSIFALLIIGASFFVADSAQAATLAPSGPIDINGQSGTVIQGVHVTSTSGPCITVQGGSSNITIKESEIGPCGTDNSTSNSQGIYITGGSSVNVYDSYIHVENRASSCGGGSHDGIFINNNDTATVTIQGNVIAYNQNNIELWDASNVNVIGNFLLNPRGSSSCADPDNLQGNQFHAWADDATPNANISVNYNYAWSSTDTTKWKYAGAVSDNIGFGVTNYANAKNNWVGVDQGLGVNPTACGIIADYKSNNAVLSGNVVSETYNCGVAIGDGSNNTIDGNKVVITHGGPSATGVAITNYFTPVVCSGEKVTNNIAYAKQSNGWVQGYYDQGVCGTVTLSGNTWDSAAYTILNPLSTTNPPPAIPVMPKNCAVVSPYTTNTSKASCGSGDVVPTTTPAFQIGARVTTAANLNVRNKANTKSGKILCTQPVGTLGTIVGGPSSAQGYTWWQINYDTSCDGWSAQDYLTTSLAAALTTPATGGSEGLITHTLAEGWTGPEVTLLQALLIKMGFFKASTTGYFGPMTAAAVASFQSVNDLEPVGFVGPRTKALLNRLGL
jgi:parallel beta-helix repeat protein